MNLAVFFSMLIAVKMISFIVSWLATKRKNNEQEYYLTDRTMTFVPLTLTLMAAVLGGGSLIGSCEEAFKFGWAFILYPIGFCIGFMVIGLGVGKKLNALKITTIAQIYEVIYKSSLLKRIASFLSITSLYLILVVQIIGSKKFLLAIGIENSLIFFIFWSAVFANTIFKGFKAVVFSHIVKMIFLIIILLGSFIWAIYKNPQIIDACKSIHFVNGVELKLSKMLGWVLMPIFFFLISQDIAQRCFSAKSSKIIVKSTIFAGIFLLVLISISIFFGIIAASYDLPHDKGASILMTSLSWTTNPILTAIAGSGFIAAITSSADSLLNSTSSNIYNDFHLNQYFSNRNVNKLVSFLIAVSSLIIGWFSNNIIDIVIISYEILICTLFVSIFLSFFNQRGHAISAFYSIFLGGGALIYFRVFSTSPLVGYQLICLAISFIAFMCGEFQKKWVDRYRSQFPIN